MKTKSIVLIPLFFLMRLGAAQFQNLDFESVMLPLVPDPSHPFMVPIDSALPNWQGYIAGVAQTNVLYSARTLSAASLNLLSTDVGDPEVLQGKYGVLLFPSPMSDVRLSQQGFVPGGSQSLRFYLRQIGGFPPKPLQDVFGIFVNGEQMNVVDLLDTPRYSVFGADISRFSEQEVTLAFTAFNGQFTPSFSLDSISFSSTPVPEPSTLSLLGLAGTLCLLCCRRKGQRGGNSTR